STAKAVLPNPASVWPMGRRLPWRGRRFLEHVPTRARKLAASHLALFALPICRQNRCKDCRRLAPWLYAPCAEPQRGSHCWFERRWAQERAWKQADRCFERAGTLPEIL